MTREEIKYASKDYVNYLLDKQEYHNENYTEDDIRQAFEKGAMLANNNPDTSSPWHDASDEPNKGILILFKDKYGYHIITWVNCNNCNWVMYVASLGVQKWAYINDLLPKGGKE